MAMFIFWLFLFTFIFLAFYIPMSELLWSELTIKTSSGKRPVCLKVAQWVLNISSSSFVSNFYRIYFISFICLLCLHYCCFSKKQMNIQKEKKLEIKMIFTDLYATGVNGNRDRPDGCNSLLKGRFVSAGQVYPPRAGRSTVTRHVLTRASLDHII